MDGSTAHVEDNMTTQRLYWYRKQRLTHNGPTSRGFVAHQLGNGGEVYSRQEAGMYSNNAEINNSSCTLGVGAVSNGRLSSCRFGRSERFSNTSNENKEIKNSQPKKDLSNLPPLDISEVIETLTTLSGEGKLGKGNQPPKEDGDEEAAVKVKGLLRTCYIFAVNLVMPFWTLQHPLNSCHAYSPRYFSSLSLSMSLLLPNYEKSR